MDGKTKQEKLAVARRKYDQHEQFIKNYNPNIDWSVTKSNTFGVSQEENDLLLKDFNAKNRNQILKELPNILYIGIHMTNIGNIKHRGIGPVELFAEKSYALSVVQRCEDDIKCPFCGKQYYGVVAITTKSLDLTYLSYSELDNTKKYYYAGKIKGKYIKLVEH